MIEKETVQREEVGKIIDKKDVIIKVKIMEYMLDAVQKTGAWSEEAGCNVGKQVASGPMFFCGFSRCCR